MTGLKQFEMTIMNTNTKFQKKCREQ